MPKSVLLRNAAQLAHPANPLRYARGYACAKSKPAH